MLVSKFARKQRISDEALCEAIARAEAGLVDADLGGGLLKQRVARAGGGKSGGYRTLVAFRAETRAVFVFGFAKSDQDNIDEDDARELKEAGEAGAWLRRGRDGPTGGRGQVSTRSGVMGKSAKTYRSEIAAAVHQTVEDIHEVGLVDRRTMREFDASACCRPSRWSRKRSRRSASESRCRNRYSRATSTSRRTSCLTGNGGEASGRAGTSAAGCDPQEMAYARSPEYRRVHLGRRSNALGAKRRLGGFAVRGLGSQRRPAPDEEITTLSLR
jgi:hypothetical protein